MKQLSNSVVIALQNYRDSTRRINKRTIDKSTEKTPGGVLVGDVTKLRNETTSEESNPQQDISDNDNPS